MGASELECILSGSLKHNYGNLRNSHLSDGRCSYLAMYMLE